MIVLSTLLEFAWLVIDGFMDANCLASLIEKGNWVPQKRISPPQIWNFPSPYPQDLKKSFGQPQKNCG